MGQDTDNGQSADHASVTGRSQNDLYSTLSAAGQYADIILIGDSDHTNRGVRSLLTSEALIKSLAESGVHHLAIEVPEQYQPLIENYQQGKISPDQFRTGMQSFFVLNQGEVTREDFINGLVETIDNANKYDIKVHAVDAGAGTSTSFRFSAESQAAWDRAESAYEQQTGLNIDTYSSPEAVQAFIMYAKEHELFSEEETQKMADEFFAARFDDSALHQNIIAAANGEKTAVIYGAVHDDLPRRLQESGMAPLVVDIYSNKAGFEATGKIDLPTRNPAGEPDIVHFQGSGQTYVTDQLESGLGRDLSVTPGTLQAFEPGAPAAPAAPSPGLSPDRTRG